MKLKGSGIGPVKPVYMVFMTTGVLFQSSVENLAYNATRCAIYSTHKDSAFTTGGYEVTHSSSSNAIAMTSCACELQCSQTLTRLNPNTPKP